MRIRSCSYTINFIATYNFLRSILLKNDSFSETGDTKTQSLSTKRKHSAPQLNNLTMKKILKLGTSVTTNSESLQQRYEGRSSERSCSDSLLIACLTG